MAFSRAFLGEDNAGVVLVSGGAAGAAEALHSGLKRGAEGVAFACPFALKIEHVEGTGIEVEFRAHELFNADRLFGRIDDFHRTGDDVGIRED